MDEGDSREDGRRGRDEFCCIDPTAPLPRALERVRTRWIGVAKRLSGNCCCLIAAATKYILFRYERISYSVARESFSMDWDVYGAHFDEIVDSLRCLGCKPFFSNVRPQKLPRDYKDKNARKGDRVADRQDVNTLGLTLML